MAIHLGFLISLAISQLGFTHGVTPVSKKLECHHQSMASPCLLTPDILVIAKPSFTSIAMYREAGSQYKAMLGVAVDLTASLKVFRDYKNRTFEVSEIHKQLNHACFLDHDFVGSTFAPYELYNELYEEDPTANVQHEDVWSVLDALPLYRNKTASLTNKKVSMVS
jgi:hypothetical protein